MVNHPLSSRTVGIIPLPAAVRTGTGRNDFSEFLVVELLVVRRKGKSTNTVAARDHLVLEHGHLKDVLHDLGERERPDGLPGQDTPLIIAEEFLGDDRAGGKPGTPDAAH